MAGRGLAARLREYRLTEELAGRLKDLQALGVGQLVRSVEKLHLLGAGRHAHVNPLSVLPTLAYIVRKEREGQGRRVRAVGKLRPLGAGRHAHVNPLSVLPILDYIVRKEREVQNLRIIARGKESGLGSGVIRDLLVGGGGGGRGARVGKVLGHPGVGILILNSEDMGPRSHAMRRRLETTPRPVVIAVGKREEEDLRSKIKRAIGVDLYK